MKSLVLHVGYSKAMSSWLQSMFRDMDGICYAEKTKYFTGIQQPSDDDIYLSKFSCRGNSGTWIESDEHMLLPQSHPNRAIAITNLELIDQLIDRIRSSQPPGFNIKIVMVLRNQVDMIISRYIQYIRGQGGSMAPSRFLDEMVFDDQFRKYMDYRYSLVIDKLESEFGKDNVLVLLQEHARQDIVAFVENLTNFIGTSFYEGLMPKKGVNVSPSRRAIEIERLINWLCLGSEKGRTGTALDRTRRKFAIYGGIFVEKIDSVVFRNKQKELIFSELEKQRIMDIFREDNIRLGDKLGIDLGVYKY